MIAAATVCGATPATAAAATWSVSPSGSDRDGGSADSPFRTVSRAAAVARAGDTVLVASGRYPETVVLSARNSGVVFRGAGQDPPVIDGEGSRAFGFENLNGDRVTIEGFEITGQTESGVYSRGDANVIAGNVVHHVGSPIEAHSNGVRVVRGRSNRVVGNTVHHIGPGDQSMGIWLLETRDAAVKGNSVYLVRKEGVRDWKGLDNAITDNRLFLSWVGISLNTSTGSGVTNNYVYDNVEGIAVKHLSSDGVLDYWGLAAGRWSRIWNNTVYRSTEAGIWIGQSGQPLDYLEVRDNIFAGAGTAYVRDSPSLRGPNVVVDRNAYSEEGGRPSWVYKQGWRSDPGLNDWTAVRRETGWEVSGGSTFLRLIAPALGDLGLRSEHSAQFGARGLGPSDVVWTPYEMTPVDSSSKGTWYTRTHLDKTADNDQNSYWMTAGNRDEHVVFDFGRARTINHLILTVYSHADRRNPRGYRFEVSDDGRSWRTVLAGKNGDASGSAHPYELPSAVTGRYLRFTMVDTFCESYAPRVGCGDSFVMSDLKAGMLTDGAPPADAAPEPEPAPAVAPPPAPVAPVARDPRAPTAPKPAPAPPLSYAPAAVPARLVVGRRATLTRAGKLRIVIRCAGPGRSGRGSVTVRGTPKRARGSRRRRARRLGHTKMRVAPNCRRSTRIGVRPAVRRRIRRGSLRRVRVIARGRGWRTTTRVVQVRREPASRYRDQRAAGRSQPSRSRGRPQSSRSTDRRVGARRLRGRVSGMRSDLP